MSYKKVIKYKTNVQTSIKDDRCCLTFVVYDRENGEQNTREWWISEKKNCAIC